MIITPLKETFLQVLITLMPVFLFLLCADKTVRGARRYTVLGLFCSISLILSMGLSYRYLDMAFDFRILPIILGIMYGGYRIGLLTTFLYITSYFLFFPESMPWGVFSDVAVYLIPLAFLFMKKFQQAQPRMKMYIASNLIMCGIAAYTMLYCYDLWTGAAVVQFDALLFMAVYGIFFMLTSYLVVFLIENILEKLSLQQQLQAMSSQYDQEAQKLKQLIDATPLCVVSVDRDGYITAINGMMLKTMQDGGVFKEEDLLGKPCEVLSHLQNTDVNLSQIRRCLNGEGAGTELINMNGRLFISSAYGIRNHETGEVVGAVNMAHDITELQMLRTELGNMERLSLVGRMAASITHEIRNPMAVVRGFVQLIKEKSPATLHEYYRIIMEELDRANSIINDFLSLAQNRIVEKEKGHLHDIINDLSPLLWADANLRGQSIELKLDPDIPQLLLNSKEIKQLILNLARNGMEAMESKGVLTIETRWENETVHLLVRDTGEGIAKDKLDKMFEPFYTTKAKGTGLGLSLCLSIVERHQGKIVVESEEGKGTTFIVSFHQQETDQKTESYEFEGSSA